MKKLQFGLLLVLFFTFSKNSSAQQWNGLTLYSNMGSSLGYLVDTNGVTTKTWNFTGGGTGYSCHMTPGGDVWRSAVNSGNALTGGGMHGKIQKWSYSGTLLWEYVYSSSSYCLHHDHCPLPNGNVLVISYDVKTPTDATNAGCSSAITIWSEKIMELKPVGTNSAIVVWQWNAWDHLVQNTNSLAANYQTSIVNNPQRLNINFATQKDWMHMNGIDYNPYLDQIALSSHNLNEWYIIDHSTTTAEAAGTTGGNAGKGGDILYRWGNPPAYQAPGTKILNVTHDAHWIPEGVPNTEFLVGVNNAGVSGPKTTIDQVNVTRTNYNYTYTPGSAFMPLSFTNRHTSTGYTSNMGSSEQFPNGNQMICLATAGTIYEINSAGTVLWTKSTSGNTPQAHRYSTCFITNPAPTQPSISVVSTDLVSTAGVTYQWYVNGNLIGGATSQTFTPTQNGIYVVRITDSNGCVYAYSAGYAYSMPVGLATLYLANNLLTVFPNPTSGILNIEAGTNQDDILSVMVFDGFGKLVFESNSTKTIDLSNLESGIYSVSVNSKTNGTINKKISLIK